MIGKCTICGNEAEAGRLCERCAAEQKAAHDAGDAFLEMEEGDLNTVREHVRGAMAAAAALGRVEVSVEKLQEMVNEGIQSLLEKAPRCQVCGLPVESMMLARSTLGFRGHIECVTRMQGRETLRQRLREALATLGVSHAAKGHPEDAHRWSASDLATDLADELVKPPEVTEENRANP